MPRLPIVLSLCALVVAGCTQSASNTAQTAPPSATPSPATSSSATSTPTLIPGSIAVPTEKAPNLNVPVPKPAATDGPPRIVDITLSERTVHTGDTVLEHVHTSLNTASVESRIGGYSLSLPKIGAGEFAVSYKVPFIPFFFHGTVDMVVIARNTAGVQTRRIVSISVQ